VKTEYILYIHILFHNTAKFYKIVQTKITKSRSYSLYCLSLTGVVGGYGSELTWRRQQLVRCVWISESSTEPYY